MTQHLLRTPLVTVLVIGLLLVSASARTSSVNADPSGSASTLLASSPDQPNSNFELRSTIAFASGRDYPSGKDPNGNDLPGATPRERLENAGEIYLMDADGANPRRLTNNTNLDDFPVLTPDG